MTLQLLIGGARIPMIDQLCNLVVLIGGFKENIILRGSTVENTPLA